MPKHCRVDQKRGYHRFLEKRTLVGNTSQSELPQDPRNLTKSKKTPAGHPLKTHAKKTQKNRREKTCLSKGTGSAIKIRILQNKKQELILLLVFLLFFPTRQTKTESERETARERESERRERARERETQSTPREPRENTQREHTERTHGEHTEKTQREHKEKP